VSGAAAFGAALLLARAAFAADHPSPWASVADRGFLRVDQRALPQPTVYA
jgi:hypothetical protein